MIKINYLKLVASIVICQMAGFIGSFFTSSSVSTWYTGLNKPFFNPPNQVFGPVWTILYLMMGISLYLVWDKGFKSERSKLALGFFIAQLVLNTIWSIIFFGLQSPLFAFFEIIILWIAIMLTIISFYKISKTASHLLIPYILWVSFAVILNLSIFLLN